MQIRYGFDIELELLQPTTIVTVMDIHPSRRSDVVEESGLHCNQDIRFEKFIDCFGNVSRRIDADAGPLAIKLQGLVNDTGLHDPVVVNAPQTSVSMLPARRITVLGGQPLLRNRPSLQFRLEAVWLERRVCKSSGRL
jgi:hypothetical protein